MTPTCPLPSPLFAPRLRSTAVALAAAWMAWSPYVASGQSQETPGAIVSVSAKPRQTMAYGMDFERLWSWSPSAACPSGLKEKQRLAELAVKECRVDYVHVAISGGAEPREGTFDGTAYAEILDCMRTLRAARPDLQFFAIPQPIHVVVKGAPYTCFPLWISVHDDKGKFQTFHWDKAADYLVRYLRFMKEQGITITYLDTKNENDKKITPDEAARMVARMREQLGDELPKIVSPSSYDYKSGVEWLRAAKAGPGVDFIDVMATHNTKERGSLEAFVKIADAAGKPAWNTELHGWTGPDDVAVTNTAVLFGQIRAGVSGISDWLSLGNEKKEHKMFRTLNDGSLQVMRIYYIYRQLVNTSGGGQYLPTTIPLGLTSTVAFLRGDTMTVWLLNGSDAPLRAVKVDLGPRQIADERARTVWWDADNGREGSVGQVVPGAGNALSADVGARTLLCLEFRVKSPAP